jgi:hypothetical protein
MADSLFVAPTINFKQTTLNGGIDDSVTTITLNSTANLQAPGYVVVDRVDSNGVSTPSLREVISYTGISGSDLTGCTRGADGSTQQAHSDLAVVETMPTVGMWNSLATIVVRGMTVDGYLKAIASPVSIARLQANQLYASVASIAQAHVTQRLEVSGASITGFGFYPVFSSSANYSGPTVAIGGVLRAPRAGTLQWVSVSTRYVVSTASIGFDFKIRDVTAFANATMRPAIAAGGTFVSTASLSVKNINQGDLLSADIATVGTDGFVRTVTIQGGTA